jgi:hypothetical protein
MTVERHRHAAKCGWLLLNGDRRGPMFRPRPFMREGRIPDRAIVARLRAMTRT